MNKGVKIKVGKLLKAHNIPKFDGIIGSIGYYWETNSSDPSIQWLQVVEHHTRLAKPILPELVKVLQDNSFNIRVEGKKVFIDG